MLQSNFLISHTKVYVQSITDKNVTPNAAHINMDAVVLFCHIIIAISYCLSGLCAINYNKRIENSLITTNIMKSPIFVVAVTWILTVADVIYIIVII